MSTHARDPMGSSNEEASGPEGRRGLDPLVELLLPTVIHRLGNATQLLTGLNGLLAMGGQESMELVASRGEDLERAGGQAIRVGYALAVLGSVQGSSLLLTRREGRGLQWLVEFLVEALRRQGIVMAPGKLPDLAPGSGDGWRAPWAVMRVLLASSLGAGEGEDSDGSPLQWSLRAEAQGWLLEIQTPEPEAWESLREDLARLAPEVRLLDAPQHGCRLPLDWLLA